MDSDFSSISLAEYVGKTLVAIEMLNMDMKVGREEERSEKMFKVLYYLYRNDSIEVYQWEQMYKFSQFSDLNKHVTRVVPHFISTEFPRDPFRMSFLTKTDKLMEKVAQAPSLLKLSFLFFQSISFNLSGDFVACRNEWKTQTSF